MWSHEIDDGSDGSGDGDSPVPENVSCPACERASGIWDARHVFNANAVYELPFVSNKRWLTQPGLLRTVAGGIGNAARDAVRPAAGVLRRNVL
jgi:hypothetical protein